MFRTLIKIPIRLSDAQIDQVYRLAEKTGVGIALWQNTERPSVGNSVWGVEGSALKILRFVRTIKKTGWGVTITDKAR